jgi:hypothetical protein
MKLIYVLKLGIAFGLGFPICQSSLYGYAQWLNLKRRWGPTGPPTFSRWKRTRPKYQYDLQNKKIPLS